MERYGGKQTAKYYKIKFACPHNHILGVIFYGFVMKNAKIYQFLSDCMETLPDLQLFPMSLRVSVPKSHLLVRSKANYKVVYEAL